MRTWANGILASCDRKRKSAWRSAALDMFSAMQAGDLSNDRGPLGEARLKWWREPDALRHDFCCSSDRTSLRSILRELISSIKDTSGTL